jgi:hypothetical protein
MADISSLTGLLPVESALDLGTDYAVNAPRKGFQLPKRGVYTLQAPPSFSSEAFGVSNAGALTAQIDPTIADGPHAGYTLRYIKVSAKPYLRKGQTVSQLGDYLKACGVSGIFTTPQDLADAVELTAGTVWQGELDWRIYKDGISIEGMEKFPPVLDEEGKATGTFQPWVNSPIQKNPDGSPKRLFANLYVRNFLGQ